MPELPEVETVRRGLNNLTLNREIIGGEVLLERTVASPVSTTEFLQKIKGNIITLWQRYGKYLIAQLSPHCSWWGVHLRMTGQLLWLNQNEKLHKHTRLRLFFHDDWELRFVDQRTFGRMWLVDPPADIEGVITGLAKLAIDPFSNEFKVEYLVNRLKSRTRPIKSALLDQSIVSGIGNIYADEALFLSRILPYTKCMDLQRSQIADLHEAIIRVLETSIAFGGTTFSNFLNIQGVNGKYGDMAWVYNRTGEPCRICSHSIQRIKLGGRSSHFCPQCQN